MKTSSWKKWLRSRFRMLRDRVQLRFLMAFSLGTISLIILLVAFQLNFDQQLLATQVTTVNPQGQEQVMRFSEYRQQVADEVEQEAERCRQRNEIFGDGTGQPCESLRERYLCVKAAVTQMRWSSVHASPLVSKKPSL